MLFSRINLLISLVISLISCNLSKKSSHTSYCVTYYLNGRNSIFEDTFYTIKDTIYFYETNKYTMIQKRSRKWIISDSTTMLNTYADNYLIRLSDSFCIRNNEFDNSISKFNARQLVTSITKRNMLPITNEDSLVKSIKNNSKSVVEKYIPKVKKDNSYCDTTIIFFEKNKLLSSFTFSQKIENERNMQINKIIYYYLKEKSFVDSVWQNFYKLEFEIIGLREGKQKELQQKNDLLISKLNLGAYTF